MRVFVTGGTGLIGVRLIRALKKRGDEVVVLSRQPDAWQRVGQDVTVVVGDPIQPGDWQDNVAKCDGVIHLAGANIFAKRWNTEFKQSIRDSRVMGTRNVVDAIGTSSKPLVSASAIGFYGPRGDEELTEDSPPGNDFMAGVCVEWEATAAAAEKSGARVTMIRTGIVHDRLGGALKTLWLPFKLGFGGPVGMSMSPRDWGKQFWSWIHYVDEVGIILLALDNPEARGPINATAPNPVTNKEFGRAFGKALNRPAFAPTPALALRLMLGEVANVITTGQRVLPKKALNLGYQFAFPEIAPALAGICGER